MPQQADDAREPDPAHPEEGRQRRCFTHYWTERTCASLVATESEGELLDHTAGNRLRSKGIGPGDHVYVVSLSKGRLVLVGKLEVERVADRHEAAEILAIDPEDMWDAEDHLIASSATPMAFDRLVPLETTERLRFLTGSGSQPLFFQVPGRLDKQTVRGRRELAPESAALLDELLPSMELIELSGSGMTFESQVQEEVYRRMVRWSVQIFGELARPHPNVPVVTIVLPNGGPVVHAMATPIGDDMAVISTRAFVGEDARITPGLMEYLLRENERLPMGGLGLDQDGRIVLDHSIHGPAATPDDLSLSVSAVASIADSLAGEIIPRWGGVSGRDHWNGMNQGV